MKSSGTIKYFLLIFMPKNRFQLTTVTHSKYFHGFPFKPTEKATTSTTVNDVIHPHTLNRKSQSTFRTNRQQSCTYPMLLRYFFKVKYQFLPDCTIHTSSFVYYKLTHLLVYWTLQIPLAASCRFPNQHWHSNTQF